MVQKPQLEAVVHREEVLLALPGMQTHPTRHALAEVASPAAVRRSAWEPASMPSRKSGSLFSGVMCAMR